MYTLYYTAVISVHLFTDTQLSTVMIENEEREVVEAVPSKQFNCTVTLSSPIGPDYSALSTIWRHNNQVVSGGSVQLVTAAAGPAVVDAFTSVLTLTSVAESDAGQYCCSAQLAGGTAPLSHCITITITSESFHCVNVWSCSYQYRINCNWTISELACR